MDGKHPPDGVIQAVKQKAAMTMENSQGLLNAGEIQSPRISFLDLPPEVRRMIYEYHLAQLHADGRTVTRYFTFDPTVMTFSPEAMIFRWQFHNDLYGERNSSSALMQTRNTIITEMRPLVNETRIIRLVFYGGGKMSNMGVDPDYELSRITLRHLDIDAWNTYKLSGVVKWVVDSLEKGKHLLSLRVNVTDLDKTATLAKRTRMQLEKNWLLLRCRVPITWHVGQTWNNQRDPHELRQLL
ncbi:Hypothetical protein D9617_27g045150 [Elsinoe fawcettii]|nr:Hypothetical protein D9617_27g045150 [Elsinoe fawcettii]